MASKSIKRLRMKTTQLRAGPKGRKVYHSPSRKDRKSAPWRPWRQPVVKKPQHYGEPFRIYERDHARKCARQEALGELKVVLREQERLAALRAAPWWRRMWRRLRRST